MGMNKLLLIYTIYRKYLHKMYDFICIPSRIINRCLIIRETKLSKTEYIFKIKGVKII